MKRVINGEKNIDQERRKRLEPKKKRKEKLISLPQK